MNGPHGGGTADPKAGETGEADVVTQEVVFESPAVGRDARPSDLIYRGEALLEKIRETSQRIEERVAHATQAEPGGANN